MSSATLTLLGLYQHGLRRNKNIFASLSFPEGIDKDIAINNFLVQGGDFEVLYTDPDLFDRCMEFFSEKWKRTFEKWLAVMAVDYAPLENYNRLEAWSDSESESISHKNSLSTSESTSTSGHTSTSDSTSNSSNTLNKISAFNETTLQNDTSAAIGAVTAGVADNRTNSINQNQSILDSKDLTMRNRLDYHRGRVHGNIGVMTTQAMYWEEWELDKLNIYDEIYILFAKEFLLPFSY